MSISKSWRTLAGLVLAPLLVAYFAATVPMSYPDGWDLAQSWMSRAQVNQILKPHDWQKNNTAYLIFHDSGLRTWYIDVAFANETVSSIRIFHEDPHDEIIGEIGYLLAYL